MPANLLYNSVVYLYVRSLVLWTSEEHFARFPNFLSISIFIPVYFGAYSMVSLERNVATQETVPAVSAYIHVVLQYVV